MCSCVNVCACICGGLRVHACASVCVLGQAEHGTGFLLLVFETGSLET